MYLYVYLYVPSKSFKWWKNGDFGFWDVKGRHRWHRWDGHDGPAVWQPQASSNWGVSTHAVLESRALVGTLLQLHPLPTSNCLRCPDFSDVLRTFREWWNDWNDWNVDRLIPTILILAILICSRRVPLRIFHNHSVIIPIAQVSVRFCECWCFSVL